MKRDHVRFCRRNLQATRACIGGISVLSLVCSCLTAGHPGMVEQLVFYGMAALPSDAVPRRMLPGVCLHKRLPMDARPEREVFRASTMRAIKCLKSIRWMPWR